jgi:hypothetical protein
VRTVFLEILEYCCFAKVFLQNLYPKSFMFVDKSFQKKLTNVFINLFFQKTFFIFVDFFRICF